MENINDSIIILSGGADSTALAYKLVAEGKKPIAISFDYGQRHKRELEMAAATCKKLNIKHEIFSFPTPKGSALTDDINVPYGHYAADNMKITVVPNRNLIMLSIAAGIAEGMKRNIIYYGAHSGDHMIYWDCRGQFVEKVNEILQLNDQSPVQIKSPFIGIDKGDIVAIGKTLNVDYSLTHTCYEGKKIPCEKCGACVERKEAFEKAEMKDPLIKNETI